MIGTLGDLRDWILEVCQCGHYAGDHAAYQPHRCLTLRDPDCSCSGFAEQSATAGPGGQDGEATAGPCPSCAGAGWKPYPDPVLEGTTSLHRCPVCQKGPPR